MADEAPVKEFPDISHKLAAPKKLSAFERDRQAAEAKRQRAEAENAAALKAFEDSFADEKAGENAGQQYDVYEPPTGPRGSAPGPRFNGSSAGPKSGPGSFGNLPGAPPSLKRKRALDEMREQQEARRELDMLDGPVSQSKSEANDQAQEVDIADDVPKPTVQLSSLPPNTSSDDVRALLRGYLSVHSVRILGSNEIPSTDKRTITAIATLTADVSSQQIDSAVSALKDKYLGFGFYLTISRHLSSATLHPTVAPNQAHTKSTPFGAEKPAEPERFSMRAAPPPRDHRGFAPPESYDSSPLNVSASRGQENPSITVRPPPDIDTVRAIHMIVERLLLEEEPERALEIEAMLMALPEVQSDERFAFLYDARSAAGVYYRFCLWAPDHFDAETQEQKRRLCGPERVFGDIGIEWLPPYTDVPFPDLQSLADVVADVDYISSDEESDDDEAERKFNTGREDLELAESKYKTHMNPLQYARLIHLLSRLPTSNARLRKGDVAQITSFAINHAGQAPEEIVNTLLLNIQKPFAYSLAAQYEDSNDEDVDDEDTYEPNDDLSDLATPGKASDHEPTQDLKRDNDPSNAKLIGLYVISDVLSASSTAGARNAWKYRQLFESGFKAQQTFEKLGKMDKELGWGRFKAEQWKRKVLALFDIWEGWSMFSPEVHEQLKRSFLEPPLTLEERMEGNIGKEESLGVITARDEQTSGAANLTADGSTLGHIRHSPPIKQAAGNGRLRGNRNSRGSSTDAIAGNRLSSTLTGQPMPEATCVSVANQVQQAYVNSDAGTSTSHSISSSTKALAPRRRMKAEDMFGDSD